MAKPDVAMDIVGEKQEKHWAWDDVSSPLAKRALEIAITGNHSILLVGPAGIGKKSLLYAAKEMADSLMLPFRGAAVNNCECGCYGSFKIACVCKVNRIAKHREKAMKMFMDQLGGRPNMLIVMDEHPYDRGRGEPVETIVARIKSAAQLVRPEQITDDAAGLLRMAMNKLGLTIRERVVKDIAATISMLAYDPHGMIGLEHVAEAIQFSSEVAKWLTEDPSLTVVK